MKNLEQLQRECFNSIKKTLASRNDYIIAGDYDKASLLLEKAKCRLIFAREIELIDDDEYKYLLGILLNSK